MSVRKITMALRNVDVQGGPEMASSTSEPFLAGDREARQMRGPLLQRFV